MTTLTIRNVEDDLERRLRVAADARGVTIEEHVHALLREMTASNEVESVSELPPGQRLRAIFADLGGVELDVPARNSPIRSVAIGE